MAYANEMANTRIQFESHDSDEDIDYYPSMEVMIFQPKEELNVNDLIKRDEWEMRRWIRRNYRYEGAIWFYIRCSENQYLRSFIQVSFLKSDKTDSLMTMDDMAN